MSTEPICGQINSGMRCDMKRVGNERVCPDCNPRSAKALQEQRDAADLANHRERIVWLSALEPKWACGTRVDTHMRNVLLKQSQAFVAAAASLATKEAP